MSGARSAIAAAAARSAAVALRATGRGATSAPGKILLKLDPQAISERAAALARGCAVISATNGKTTTSAILAGILRADGYSLIHNEAGANMAGGIAATLLDQDGDFGLFEVDEFWLDGLVEQLSPRAVLLGNLFRDQLDRYGELDQIVARWRAVANSSAVGALVLNGDDPLVAQLGRERADTVYFGIEDRSIGSASAQHASEQAVCPQCGAQYLYSSYFVGHLGHYSCPNGHAARPQPTVSADEIVLDGLAGSQFILSTPAGSSPISLALPGLYNVYNAVAAAALGLTLGVALETVVSGLCSALPAFGRGETLQLDGRDCSILLIKNPAGANEVIRTLAAEQEPAQLLLVLNDQIADGRDISWIWDADFEQLAPIESGVTCSGNRATEMALRLKYAGIDERQITTKPALSDALDIALGSGSGRLCILPTYTAMLELRELLVARGAVTESF